MNSHPIGGALIGRTVHWRVLQLDARPMECCYINSHPIGGALIGRTVH
jgi:transcription elongation GreA/GreB family factor